MISWSHNANIVWMEADGTEVVVWGESVPGPEPTTLLEAVRDAAWGIMDIPYNPDAALLKFAQQRGMGAPLTTEFDFTFEDVLYRGQGFAMGIAYCEVNRWEAIWSVLW